LKLVIVSALATIRAPPGAPLEFDAAALRPKRTNRSLIVLTPA